MEPGRRINSSGLTKCYSISGVIPSRHDETLREMLVLAAMHFSIRPTDALRRLTPDDIRRPELLSLIIAARKLIGWAVGWRRE
jgi:hypothetical protein